MKVVRQKKVVGKAVNEQVPRKEHGNVIAFTVKLNRNSNLVLYV